MQAPSSKNSKASNALISRRHARISAQSSLDNESKAETSSGLSNFPPYDDESNLKYSASFSPESGISQCSFKDIAKESLALSCEHTDGPSEVSRLGVRNAGSIPSQQHIQIAAYRPKTPFWTLCNPGNLCFLNSLLQNIARLPPLMAMLEGSPDASLSALDAKAHLSSAFNHFCRQVNSDGRKSMRASKTTEVLHCVLPDLIAPFASGRQHQQDAHEVLLRLIEKLDDDGRSNGLCYFNVIDTSLTRHFGHPLSAICSGFVRQEITCSKCTLTRDKNETFLCLSVPIPAQTEVSVDSMLAAYFSDVEVQYKCSMCDCSTAALQQKVTVWPTVLILHFLRWRGGSKMSTSIKIPAVWSSPSDNSCPMYNLNGYILHHGPQANVGHYSAVVRISNCGSDEYFRVSDDLMDSQAIEKSVYHRDGFPSRTCYLAFYVASKYTSTND